jgi:fumarylacetoacetase
MACGPAVWSATRNRLSELFKTTSSWGLEASPEHRAQVLRPISEVTMHLPARIGDYTDFYASREHATNVGKMFRDPENALLPNWLHLPVGYHGRASTVVVSGTDIYRPNGQRKGPQDPVPVFGPSVKMDFELEVGFLTAQGPNQGDWISTEKAESFIFGLVLFNDWSARDIQQWEYVPLGPFLGKNFASSLSPWVVLLEALEPFRVDGPVQEPQPLPYLQSTPKSHIDLHLEVGIVPESGTETIVSKTNFKHMYWSMAQQLAHHTVNGCAVKAGDLMASGTISGEKDDSFGSLLELSWNGSRPLLLHDGGTRTFLEDGDTVVMRGHCEKDGIRIGFGEVEGKLLPAKAWKP